MISALIAWGIGFGGVNYLPTHGLTFGVAPPWLPPTSSWVRSPDSTSAGFTRSEGDASPQFERTP